MRIYTGQTTGTKLEKIKSLDLGICISSNPNTSPSKDFGQVPCFLDNGAFSCYAKGYPFQEDVFLKTMSKAYAFGIKLDFIVCPDLLMKGKESLQYSMEWARGNLKTASNLALVVQDGITPEHITDWYVWDRFTHLFIGGSVDWKWETAKIWREYTKEMGKKLHIGQCGQLKYLKRAYELGADSVDSTSFCRNESWHIVEEFNSWKDGYNKTLFEEGII